MTPQPNEPTAEAIAFNNFEADCNRGLVPTLCDMVQVGAYVRTLRHENERLRVDRDGWRDRHWMVHHHFQEQSTELTQLRASLSTAVERAALAEQDASMSAEQNRLMHETFNERCHEVTELRVGCDHALAEMHFAQSRSKSDEERLKLAVEALNELWSQTGEVDGNLVQYRTRQAVLSVLAKLRPLLAENGDK